MSYYAAYIKETGQIISSGYCTDGSEVHQGESVYVSNVPIPGDGTHYIEDEKLKRRPDAPSDYHSWDIKKKEWVEDRDRLVATLKNLENASYTKQASAPVLIKGARFDASESSIGIIQQRLQVFATGVSLPNGFVWRDVDNVLHPCDAELLKSILQTFLDRDYSLRQKLWENKSKIDAMSFEEALLALKCKL